MWGSHRKPLCMTSAAHGITRLNSCSSSAPAGRVGLATSASLSSHCRCYFLTNSFHSSPPTRPLGHIWRSCSGCSSYEYSSWSESERGLGNLWADAHKRVYCDRHVYGIILISLFHQYRSHPLSPPQPYWRVFSINQCKCHVPPLKSMASNPEIAPCCIQGVVWSKALPQQICLSASLLQGDHSQESKHRDQADNRCFSGAFGCALAGPLDATGAWRGGHEFSCRAGYWWKASKQDRCSRTSSSDRKQR